MLGHSSLDYISLVVVMLLVLNWDDVVVVLLRFDNLFLNRLNMYLVVVLMYFSINGSCHIFMLSFSNTLVYNGRLGLLVDVDGVVVLVMEKLRNGLLSGLHCG